MAVEEKEEVGDTSAVLHEPIPDKKAKKKGSRHKESKKRIKRAKRAEAEGAEGLGEDEEPKSRPEVKFSLSEAEAAGWRTRLEPIFSRYLVMTKSFALVRSAFFLDYHQVIQTSIQHLAHADPDNAIVNAEGVHAPKSFLLEFIRNELWLVAKQHYGVPESEIDSILGDQAVAEIASHCQRIVTLPSLSFDGNVLLQHPEVHSDGLKSLLETTLEVNNAKLDRLSFELNDAFATYRQSIQSRMKPMRSTNDAIAHIFGSWQEGGSMAEESPMRITTVPFDVACTDLHDHLAYLGLVVTVHERARNEQLNLFDRLSAWLGQPLRSIRLGNIELKHCDADYVKDRAETLDGKAKCVGDYIFAEEQNEEQWIPENLSVASRYLPVDFFKETLETYKQLATQLQTGSSMAPELPTPEEVEEEIKYVKMVLSNWEKRKKIFQKTDKWTVQVFRRKLAPGSLKPAERKALEDRFLEYSLQRWAREAEFQTALRKEVKDLQQRLFVYALLGRLDMRQVEAMKALVLDLAKKDDRLDDLDCDLLPGATERQKRNMRVWKVSVLGQVEGWIAVDGLSRDAAKGLLKLKKEEAKALKKLKKKEESLTIKSEVSLLRAMCRDWQARGAIVSDAEIRRISISVPSDDAGLTEAEAEAVKRLQPPEALHGKKAAKLVKSCRTLLKDSILPSLDRIKSTCTLLDEHARAALAGESAVAIDFTPLLEKSAESVSPESLSATLRPTKQNSSLLASLWEQYFLCLIGLKASSDGEAASGLQSKIARTIDVLKRTIIPYLADEDRERLSIALEEHQDEIDEAIKRQAARETPRKIVVGDETQEVAGLLLLSRGLMEVPPAGEESASTVTGCKYVACVEERLMLLEFLAYAKDHRMQLNARMTKMKDNLEMVPHGVSDEAVKFMCTFSFKSRHIDSLAPLTEKLSGLWATARSGGETAAGSRMTLKELGILRTMDKWGASLERLIELLQLTISDDEVGNNKAAVSDHPVAKLLVCAVRSHRELRRTYHSISERIREDETYKSGDLLLAIWKKKQLTMQGNRPPATFNFLMSLTKYEHTAKVYRNVSKALGPLGEPRLSHMYREYHDSVLAIEEIAYSHIFRLLLRPLVTDKATIASLSEQFGDQWGDVIQKRYHALEAKLHASQGTLQHISNPISRVMGIGTAAVLPWTKRHRKAADFNKTRADLVEENAEDLQMTCSEFAINATIACLLDLNEQLKKELGDESLPDQIIPIPFPAKEKFSTMQPERLRQLLYKKKALTQVDPPAFISSLLA